MLCEKCKSKPASRFIKQVIDEITTELYVCAYCEGQTTASNKFNLFSKAQESNLRCECNTDFHQISQSGYVGCPKCYTTFEQELEPIITALHTKAYHTGKRKISKLELCQQQLEKARKNNFHSLALKLEKQISQLMEEDNAYDKRV